MKIFNRSSSSYNSKISRLKHDDENNKTINVNNRIKYLTKKEKILSFLNTARKNDKFNEDEKKKEKENNNVIKVNIKRWKDNSPRLNSGIFNNDTYSKFKDKIGDSINSKSIINTTNKKSSKKRYNLKNIKNKVLFTQNKLLLTEKVNIFIKKLKKIIYRKTIELIKEKYYIKNRKYQKNTCSIKSKTKNKEKQTSTIKKEINNKVKIKNNMQNNNNKNNNPLFLYNTLGLNILGTQPSKKSNINQSSSPKKKRKKNKDFSISNPKTKNINKKLIKKKKDIKPNKNSVDKKFKKYLLTDKKKPKAIENKKNIIKSNPNISEFKENENDKKEKIKYHHTENHSEIIKLFYIYNKTKSTRKASEINLLLNNQYSRNENNINDIIYEKIQNNENDSNLDINIISSNNNIFESIKISFNLWKSEVISQKILNSFIYKSKLNKFMMKFYNIFIKKLLKIMKICLLYKYFIKYKDKCFRRKIINNLKIIKNKSIKRIDLTSKEINKYDIINNININNYIYSDYNKFIKRKKKNPDFVSKLICSKKIKNNLIEDLNNDIKHLNLFENKQQNININLDASKYNNYSNYIFCCQTERSYNNIKSNLFLDNNTNDDIINLKSININEKKLNLKNISIFNINDNDDNIRSQKISNNLINQINQLRMVLNLIEQHKIKSLNLHESFHKWALVTKLNIRKNTSDLFWSFKKNNANTTNKKNSYVKYSINTYNKKIKNVAFSSKKSDRIKKESENIPNEEINIFRINTIEKIPYFNYCNSSNTINMIENKNNVNINSFELIENNNNIKNNYVYHKKIINISNISVINNCFLDNNNIINNNNASMNLTSTSLYSNKTNSIKKYKFIEEKKLSLKKLNRIEEREINFTFFKKNNNNDNNYIKLNKLNVNQNDSNANKEILFNNKNYSVQEKSNKNIINHIFTNYNYEVTKEYNRNKKQILNEEYSLKRSKSFDFKKRKNHTKSNIIKKYNSSFSFFKTYLTYELF